MSGEKSSEAILDALLLEYSNLWKLLFREVTGVSPASLHLEVDQSCSYYDHERDELHISLGQWDTDELTEQRARDTRNSDEQTAFPTWKRELVHEVLHEFQYKFLACESSEAGRALHQVHASKFSGQGHGPDYFTAVHRVSSLLGMSPEALIGQI